MEIDVILAWAIVTTIILGIIIVFFMKFHKTHEKDIKELESKLATKQSKAIQLGINTTKGDYTQILGDFAFLPKYDQLITLSTTSKQPSLDLIGISKESIDFLEIKKKGAPITHNENQIRRLIEEKKVSYKVFDIELPENFTMEERKLKELKK